jgi:hypothetical protein
MAAPRQVGAAPGTPGHIWAYKRPGTPDRFTTGFDAHRHADDGDPRAGLALKRTPLCNDHPHPAKAPGTMPGR